MYTEKTECVSTSECIHNILNRPHNIIYTSGERERERERERDFMSCNKNVDDRIVVYAIHNHKWIQQKLMGTAS